ncbi:uncharacterized protein TNCV_3644521 [Trichonephila clavipes]|nr:uncharacterized protein TNCV_3644521 [Trichonephila clavipes]
MARTTRCRSPAGSRAAVAQWSMYRIVADTRGFLATDHVVLNHGQVTWTTPELAPPLLTTTPHQWEDASALDRFNVHPSPTRPPCCQPDHGSKLRGPLPKALE